MKSVDYSRKDVIRKVCSLVLTLSMVFGGFIIVFPIIIDTAEGYVMHDPFSSTSLEDGGPKDGDGTVNGVVVWKNTPDPVHVIDSGYFIDGSYELIIEQGCTVRFANSGFLINFGDLTAKGSPASTITFTSNETLPVPGDWEWIFIDEPGNATMDYCTVEYAGIAGYSLRISTNGDVTISNSTFRYNIANGIRCLGEPGISIMPSPNIVKNDFYENEGYAISVDSSDAFIDDNTIYGLNASAGGGDGGGGIYLENPFGPANGVTISKNTIIGGSGGDDAGLGGGAGGYAIYDDNYDGFIRIINNELILGGRGGNNTGSDRTAGKGGGGIYLFPVPNMANAIEISDNNIIKGGRGGENYALFDGNASDGGDAINITDNDNNGQVLIYNNDNILGGDGGDNHANWGGMPNNVWTSGDGGGAVSLYNCRYPCVCDISLNPNIRGGKGGNTTGTGTMMIFPFPSGGNGGNGISLSASDSVTITRSTSTGGDGGNNTPFATETSSGNGGHGVVLNSLALLDSNATITGSDLIGGEGGDNWVMMLGEGLNGRGGNALYSIQSTGSVEGCDLTGGRGGDNYGPGAMAGPGGSGFYGTNAYDMVCDITDIKGGKGGNNYHSQGIMAGWGGEAANILDCNNIRIEKSDLIVGGDGGDVIMGAEPGYAAGATMNIQSSSDIILDNNNITTGVGGINISSGQQGANGSYCVYGWWTSGVIIAQNEITAKPDNWDTYGIYLGSANGLYVDLNRVYKCNYGIYITQDDISSVYVLDNDIYENDYGVYLINKDLAQIGDYNRIYDNTHGIYLWNSDATVGDANTLTNNDHGITCRSSNPTITNNVITDSEIGMNFTQNSNANIFRTQIIDSNVASVHCDSGSNPSFYNCTISSANPLVDDFYVTGNSHPWTLNTTFDKAKTDFGDTQSSLTVNWYMNVRVVDVDNIGVPSALLWVNDTFGTPHIGAPFVTPFDGWVRWVVVTEYIENQTSGKFYYTPHNASATEGLRFGYTIADMYISRNVIVVLDGIQFQIPLKKGWNMISVPMNQSDTTITKVLEYIDGKYRAVQWYDASDGTDQWKHYRVGKPFGNDLQNIDRKMGIWIYMYQDDVLSLVGSVPSPTTTGIQLRSGWNLVGYPSLTTRFSGTGANEAFEFISGPGSIDMVMYYNASDASDPWKMWDPGSYSPDDLVQIEPGYGLYIHVTDNCIWDVDW
ncbi:MAG: right-handed parallel beta-helix repeat-containing protein [Thermoplasmata archaeon]|nr:MAG: right-handed parallel beta-helix repeat-containing protein [Thermoplasmata archaeon]